MTRSGLSKKALALDKLTPPFAKLVTRSLQPFVSTIADIVLHRVSCFDGRLLLVGDALTNIRPHIA